jgi:hypothetical protein
MKKPSAADIRVLNDANYSLRIEANRPTIRTPRSSTNRIVTNIGLSNRARHGNPSSFDTATRSTSPLEIEGVRILPLHNLNLILTPGKAQHLATRQ